MSWRQLEFGPTFGPLGAALDIHLDSCGTVDVVEIPLLLEDWKSTARLPFSSKTTALDNWGTHHVQSAH